MGKIDDPTEEKAPQEPGQAPEEPGVEGQKAQMLSPEERVANLEKIILVQLPKEMRAFSEGMEAKLKGMQAAAPSATGGIVGTAQQYFPLLQQIFGIGANDPMETLYSDIGRKFVDATISTTMKRVIKTVGGETASHVAV